MARRQRLFDAFFFLRWYSIKCQDEQITESSYASIPLELHYQEFMLVNFNACSAKHFWHVYREFMTANRKTDNGSMQCMEMTGAAIDHA